MDLQKFIKFLESEQQLARIAARVSPDLEFAAITDRVCKEKGGGKALLFENIGNARFPLVTNVFGSEFRMSKALSCSSYQEVDKKLSGMLSGYEGSFAEKLASRLEESKVGDNDHYSPVCQQVHCKPNLEIFPKLKFWPGDSRGFITLAQVMTKAPETGIRNLGIYRVQIQSADTLTINFLPGSGGGEHYKSWMEQGQSMPVTIAIGGDPAMTWAASAPLPHDCDELDFTGVLRGKNIQTTPALSQPLDVPSDGEMIIEGEVQVGHTMAEGVFGNHTGTYQGQLVCPVLKVTAVTHRRDPLLPVTLVGPPPMENSFMAKASERLLSVWMRNDFQEVQDIFMPVDTIFHGCCFISVDKELPCDGLEYLTMIRKNGPLSRAKMLVLVDANFHFEIAGNIFWQVMNRIQKGHMTLNDDLLNVDARLREGIKIICQDEAVNSRIEKRWKEYGLN